MAQQQSWFIARATLAAMFVALIATQGAQAQTYSVFHSFDGADGWNANGELIQDSAGNLYGTTYQGGTNTIGIVFKLDPSGNETILHDFGTFLGVYPGVYPQAGLLRDSTGTLYGTTAQGSYGFGIVFRLDTNGVITTLHNFTASNPPDTDGGFPTSKLVSINGELYGSTQVGGGLGCDGNHCGTIFKITKDGTETVLYSFTGGADGAHPQGVIRDVAGNLYGVASAGGSGGAGTVWKLDAAGVFSVLYAFTGGADGGTPMGRLIRDDKNGTLRGVTLSGGDSTCNCGLVFSLDTSGAERVIHKFFRGGGGSKPLAGVLDVGGALYGTASRGGDLTCEPPRGCGVLYRIEKTGQYSVLHRFAGSAAADGADPNFGSLTLGSDGSIYGGTYTGGNPVCGAGGCGVIFKYIP